MSGKQRRAAGVIGAAVGAVLASPLIALLGSPVANADAADAAVVIPVNPDVVTLGPYSIGLFTDTLSYTESPFAFDEYLAGPLDLDIFYGGPTSFEILFTDPGYFQVGFDDVGGTFSVIDNFPPAEFFPPDPGLAELGVPSLPVIAEAIAGLSL